MRNNIHGCSKSVHASSRVDRIGRTHTTGSARRPIVGDGQARQTCEAGTDPKPAQGCALACHGTGNQEASPWFPSGSKPGPPALLAPVLQGVVWFVRM